jgi:hypothetical protein
MRIGAVLLINLLLVLGISVNSAAQPVTLGLGFRLSPDGGGLTAKFLPEKHIVLEAQLNASAGYYNGPGVAFVGLLEYNIFLPDPSWHLFVGPGMHFGGWDRWNDGHAQGIFGLDGIFGIEYLFWSAPIGLSVDIKPAINLVRDYAFYPDNFFGLSGTYYFRSRAGHPSHYSRY